MPEAQRDIVPHATKSERQICQKNISGYKEQKSITIYLDDPLYHSCIQTDRSARTKNNAAIVSSSDGLRMSRLWLRIVSFCRTLDGEDKKETLSEKPLGVGFTCANKRHQIRVDSDCGPGARPQSDNRV